MEKTRSDRVALAVGVAFVLELAFVVIVDIVVVVVVVVRAVAGGFGLARTRGAVLSAPAR